MLWDASLMPAPNWHRIYTCLHLSVRGPRTGMSGHRRRCNRVLGPGTVTTQQQRDVATLQRGHPAIVRDGELRDLTDSAEVLPPNSTDATRSTGRLPCGSLVQPMLAVLTLTKRIRFDLGIVPPGSYSPMRYLLAGDPR